MPKAKKSERGSVGEQVFKQVRALIAKEKVNVTKAFRMLAEKSGGNERTIAANYYRVARRKGVVLRPRGKRASAGPGKASAVLSKAEAVIRELGAIVRQQEERLASLTAENERFEAIRKLLRKAG